MSITNSICFFAGVLLCFLITIPAAAQLKQVNSPYSRVGIGTVQSNNFAVSRAMGGTAAAFQSPFNINYNNPASYSALARTALEVGLEAEGLWLATNTAQQNSGTGAISYVALGFPITKFWGANVGLSPYSYLNYDMTETRVKDGLDTLSYRFVGSGQLYQAYIGNGFNIKGFSVGFNIGYLFGTQNRQTFVDLINVNNALDNIKRQEVLANGFVWNAGLQQRIKMGKKLSLLMGLSANAPHTLNVTQNEHWERAVLQADFVSVVDTTSSNFNQMGTMILPTNIRGGILLAGNNDWFIGTDVLYEKWSEFRHMEQADSSLQDGLTFTAGIGFTPERSAMSFLKRVNYRFGGYYKTGHIKIGDTSLSSFALTAGAGIPIPFKGNAKLNRKNRSYLNFSIEVGQRGSLQNSLVRETFAIATFGFTLNDKWFEKYKLR